VSPLHPAVEPFAHGRLDAGGGQSLYWEAGGNPAGIPAVVLHGGPGSGYSAEHRRFFDPARYRVLLLDQRGCGRSTPSASDPATPLEPITTAHMVADVERLRAQLEIDRWVVLGTSWGATLALAYAERHPRRVAALVLAAVTMTRRSEIDWLYRGVARFLPAEFERFRAGRDGDLVEAYARLLDDPDPAVRQRAADEWSRWELATVGADPWPSRWASPAFRLGRARIVTHVFRHGAWLDEGALLRDAGALAGIPGVMIHGRLDLGSPLVTAWELARAWPDGELVVVEGAGHGADEPGMAAAIVAATGRFAEPGSLPPHAHL
jgi:proline iminopeptidase